VGGADEPAEVVDRGGDGSAVEGDVGPAAVATFLLWGAKRSASSANWSKDSARMRWWTRCRSSTSTVGDDHDPGAVFGGGPATPHATQGGGGVAAPPRTSRPFIFGGCKERLRRHGPRGGHRVGGVDVEVGVEEHREKGWCLSKMRGAGAGVPVPDL